jgi:HEAT repeat protein/lysophospholipase L1-like esterase
MSGPRQSLLVNILLSAGVSAGTLALAEAWARHTEAPLTATSTRQALAWKADFYTIRAADADWPAGREFNRDGVRDRAHAPEKPDGVRRIVCLGDSVTFGPDGHPEQAYPQILQEKLDAIGPGYEVFNLSLWGWATTQEHTAYTQIARRYRPDDVVLGVCLNDIQDLENELARPPALLAALHKRSALVRRIVDARGREIRGIEELFTDADAPRVVAGLARLEAEILSLRRDVEADHAHLEVVLFPFRGQLGSHPPAPAVQQRLRDFCQREHLPFLDPLDAMRPLGEAAFLEGDGIHLSAAGGAAVAQAVLHSDLIPVRTSTVAVDALLATVHTAVEDPSADRRRDGAWAIGRRGSVDRTAVAALNSALADREERVRAEAIAAAERLRLRELAPELAHLLADPRQAVRWRAASALASFGPPRAEDVPLLASHLSDADSHVAQFAAWVVGEAGDGARPAIPALCAALRASDLAVRTVAAQSLGRIGAGDAMVVTALGAAVADESWPARWHAVRALGHLGTPAVAPLVDALKSRDETVRLEAALALGRLGSGAAAAESALDAARRDENPQVRAAVSKALHHIARR